jgi:hypothetical protein
MKRLLLIIALSCCYISTTKAQINLNYSDLGVPVRSYDIRIDSAVTSAIVPGMAGTNQTWNFLSLHSTLDTLHLDLINSSYGVQSNFFPLANIAYHANNKLNYNYYNSSATGLVHYGIVSDYLNNGDTIKLVLNQPDTALKLPANYLDICNSVVLGDSRSRCHYSFDTNFNGFPVTVPIDTLRIKHLQTHNSSIDAWGSMTTPTDIFPALRQKNINRTVDSIWGYANVPAPYQSYSGWYQIAIIPDSNVTYNWWMKGLGIPAVKMEMYKFTNVVYRVSWVRDVFASITEKEDPGVGVYPNPANDLIIITQSDDYSEAIIYDMLGNVVKRQDIQNMNKITIPVGNLPNGMYFYNLLGKNVTSGKFVVKHQK